MPLDPRAQRFLAALAASRPRNARDTSVSQRREAVAQLGAFAGRKIAMRSVADRLLPLAGGDLPVRLYTPEGAEGSIGPGLVYFHGGGLVAGSLETHDGFARALARAAGARVVSVGYRLAPEHPFPAAYEDALGAVRYLGAHAANFGIDAANWGVCGDSAGATLAAAACQGLRRLGGPRPALQLLLCPILDHSRLSASRREFASGYLVDRATLAHDLQHYLPPGAELADPRISPLAASDLTGLPPALIHAAECDPLRDEACAYAERLRQAGIGVTYTCHPGMIHLFYALAGVIPYADSALARIGEQVRACWDHGERDAPAQRTP